jgi:Tfp pilus assembly pilus retraction ATPase PilT
MREAFPYENNAFLMSQILVPDPLPKSEWNGVTRGWEADDREVSLLEWIIGEGWLAEDELMHLMAEAGGVEIASGRTLNSIGESADRKLLEGNGFAILGSCDGIGVVTGGPDFPPNLRAYLGNRAAQWKWVLTSPLRGENEPSRFPDTSPKLVPVSETGLETWIASLLKEAQLPGASDIHFERDDRKLVVRMRTRSGMQDLAIANEPRSLECMRYLKRMADFSMADNPLPQDGRIQIGAGGRETAYRASHIRTVTGETLVLRSINRATAIPPLADLGIPGDLRKLLRQLALSDTGLILCTGATGSGKSTTLFSLLNEINEMPLKIISIEDPVEVELPNVTQSSVDTENGWTFPEALRAYLRQDPDIILVGEIRDKESAEGAARAALTGHLVLSTLHAASPLTALDRLHAWGLPPGLIAETVGLVTHQRLVHGGAVHEPRARFKWIRTEPEQTYRYFRYGEVPGYWRN